MLVPAAFINSSAQCNASAAVSLVSIIVGIFFLSSSWTASEGILVLIAIADRFFSLLAFLYVAA